MRVDFSQKMMFSFEGPNLCLLGNEQDFKSLGEAIVDLTSHSHSYAIELTALDFIEITGEKIKVIFASKPGADLLGKIINNNELLFELDSRYWERIFIFIALMSWDKKTYYLNSFEDALRDLPLDQECHLICSSEF